MVKVLREKNSFFDKLIEKSSQYVEILILWNFNNFMANYVKILV